MESLTWSHTHGITYMQVGIAGFGDDEDDRQEAVGPCQAPCQYSLCPPSSCTRPPKAAPTPSSPRFAHRCSIMLNCWHAASQCSVSVPLLFLYRQPVLGNVHAPKFLIKQLYLLLCELVLACLQKFCWILKFACLFEQPVRLPCHCASLKAFDLQR